MVTIVQARVARDKLMRQLDPSLKAAVGLGGNDSGPCVEVRIPNAAAPGQIPDQIDGVHINVVVTGPIRPARK